MINIPEHMFDVKAANKAAALLNAAAWILFA